MTEPAALRLMTVVSAMLLAGAAAPVPFTPLSFRNTDLPAEQRITSLLALMTIDEKIDALSTDSGVSRLGVPSFGSSEGIHGVVQRGEDKRHRDPVPTTQFPQPPGMGASWDPALVREAGRVEGHEARYITQTKRYDRRILMLWGPQADLARDPRWGRSEEVYGEDPYLNGTMATAFARGLEGDDRNYWQAAPLLKHFLANSNENQRTSSSSNFDTRLFWEYYSVPFRMAFQNAGASGVMASYNSLNGTPMAINPVLRSTVIRTWDVDLVSSDGDAVSLLVTAHKSFATKKEAVVATLKAGINQYLDTYKDELRAAVREGSVRESELDEALRRKFRITLKLGLLDPPERVPYSTVHDGPEPWNGTEDQSVSKRMALESIVLLKNSRATLPLTKDRLRSVAVIGPLADQVHGDWYGGHPPYATTPLQGIRDALGPNVQVSFTADDKAGAAAVAARAADVAVVVVGNDPTCGPNMAKEWDDTGTTPCADPGDGREGRDRVTLTLAQEELVRRVKAANPHMVMVLVSSFPYLINWSQRHVPAIVQMAHASQDEGWALSQVLFGNYDPGGHTTVTWPASMDQIPPMMDYDIRHGRTYMYARAKPLYPFGYGLSYTRFRFSHLRTGKPVMAHDGQIDVMVDVTNDGRLAGDAVPQIYVRHLDSRVQRPAMQLVGFHRVNLAAGETKTVHITVQASTLAYWDDAKKALLVEPEHVEILCGTSSADLTLRQALRIS